MGIAVRVMCVAFAATGCRIGFDDRVGADGALEPDAAISGCEVPSAGSVACFPFEGNGSDVAHQHNATTTAVTYEVGRVGEGVRLASSSLITVPDAPAIHLSSAGTIAAWIRIDALPAAGARSVIVDTNSYGMAVRSTGDIECFYTGAYQTFAAAIVVGTWAHVVCTYDGTATTLWKDGAVVASQPDSGPVTNGGSGLKIGSNIPDPNHPNQDLFLGMFDEVGIWSVALTAAEICAAAGHC